MDIYAGDDKPVYSDYSVIVNGKKIIKYTLEFNKSRRRNMSIHEHQRWNSFMISRGIVPATRDQILNETAEDPKTGKIEYTNGKNYALRRHGNITTFDGLVEFRRMRSLRDELSELETDVIKYDYQLLDDAYWLLSSNGFKIIRKRDVIE